MSVVILADGKFPDHKLPLEVLKSAQLVVCCDGAAKKLVEWGRNPDAITGDLDSIPAGLKQQFGDRIYPSYDQETNDLTKAVEWCIARSITDVVILGATGLRDDHTLGNISLLVDYVEKINVKMMTDTGVFIPIVATTRFNSTKGQQISIFAITPQTPITTHGLMYSVYNRLFTNWWQGTLNEAEGSQFTIEFENGKLIIFMVYT
ncbi:MAG: thiamine diphosphokinase [Prevotellaceae bacterium]|jgi:thiamine pyrophosphokinase|nr:thiamine diphosphokinase [Prevotellaceae bacterium]